MKKDKKISSYLKNVNSDAETWNQEVMKRVGFSFDPTNVSSVLFIQPGASGDVALSTTLFARVKFLNPNCSIAVMTRSSTASVALLCPYVDSVEIIPDSCAGIGRRELLAKYFNRADAVLHIWYFIEDEDLGSQYNLLETIWLLAGLPKPDLPLKIQLQCSNSSSDVEAILAPSIGVRATLNPVVNAIGEFGQCFKKMFHQKSIWKSGFRVAADKLLDSNIRCLRSISRLTSKLFGRRPRYVILSTTAFSVDPPPRELSAVLVEKLIADGWTVLDNVRSASDAIPGTLPLVCSYDDFLSLRELDVPLVAWRSGLCDIAASAATTPMVALYPRFTKPHPRPIMDHFSFKSMGIETNCFESVCESTSALDWSAICGHLRNRSHR